MQARLTWGLAAVVVMTFAAARPGAGGWAVITLKDVPEYMVAGKSVSLTYAVRQHGVQLTPGLSGWIEARDAGGGLVKAAASPAADTGYYLAKLTLPTAGDWTLTVHGGFWESKSAAFSMRVVPGGADPIKLTAVERGKALMAAKGCVTCHTHQGVSNPTGLRFAPDLTTARLAPASLKTFLADPSIKPPSRPGLVMPNLQLTHTEIGALVAFLSPEPAQAAVAR